MAKKFAPEIGPLRLPANLAIPDGAAGVVIFAHGSGSSRLSPRNIHVAERLNGAGFATLLFDLLTDDEAADRANVFDIPLLGGRMVEALAFARSHPQLQQFPVGFFGASTGAAAALLAAARHGSDVAAIVSRGGRPDLALDHLGEVRAPTLLIVGGLDGPVIDMNRTALAALRCEKCLEIVPGATHLFEEPGKLDRVVALATGWFARH
ncbi:MAG: dienelactone hydrolase family protein, partial [Rhizobiales bacterium]|nr:dienelactone hydrolase family protein [Hyphomicrobiales bacterium]